MTKIDSLEKYERFFPYDKKYLKERWIPSGFPCFCTKTTIDGGLGGDGYQIEVFYIPTNIDSLCSATAFARGLTCEPQIIKVY